MTFQRTTFNVKIKIVQRCFVMFTLFNLQGTLAVSEALFRTSPLIIAFCQPLVKYFFQSFSSFSDFFLSRPPRAEKNRGLLKTSVLALRIFPVSHPTSIVRANELNFCVRDGNRWTLAAINTNYFFSRMYPENRTSMISSLQTT